MRGHPVHYNQLSGGLNLRDQPYALDAGECRDCQNVIFTETGAIKKRDGTTKFTITDTGLLDCLFNFQLEDGTKFLLSHQIGPPSSGIKRYLKISSSGVVDIIAGGDHNSGLTGAEAVFFKATSGQGPIWVLNGDNGPHQWDGAAGGMNPWTLTAGGVPPNGRFLKVYGNRIFIAGAATAKSTLYFSELNDPRNFPTANTVELRSQDGDQITGLGLEGDSLLVFKRNACWAVYDSDVGANRILDSRIGCVSPRSIASTPYGLLFLADDGVYWTNGNSVRNISQNIRPFFNDIAPAYKHNACGIYYKDHYYISVTTLGDGVTPNTVNDITLGVDLRTMSTSTGQATWTKHTLGYNQFAVQDEALYGANTTSQRIDKIFVPEATQDVGTNYKWLWQSPYYAFGNPYIDTRMRQIQFDGTGEADVRYVKNFNPGLSDPRTGNFQAGAEKWAEVGRLWAEPGFFWGGGAQVGRAALYELGNARSWGVEFSSASDKPCSIYSITFGTQTRKN